MESTKQKVTRLLKEEPHLRDDNRPLIIRMLMDNGLSLIDANIAATHYAFCKNINRTWCYIQAKDPTLRGKEWEKRQLRGTKKAKEINKGIL